MNTNGRSPTPAFASFCAKLPARFSMIMPGGPNNEVNPAGYPAVQTPQFGISTPNSAGQKKRSASMRPFVEPGSVRAPTEPVDEDDIRHSRANRRVGNFV